MTNPVAVPTMLTTAKIANAKDLYFSLKRFTFWGINQRVAIFVGALRINGWAMAQKNWPIMRY